jgi:epoxyqueuosine reductase
MQILSNSLDHLRAQAQALGFADVAVAGVDLSAAEQGLLDWLALGYHGSMDYMQRHGLVRARPAELIPGTQSVVTVRMDYLPPHSASNWPEQELARLDDPCDPIISLYARGRDYHKVLRQRLQQLAHALEADLQPHVDYPVQTRVFTDSAPVLEVELAQRSGLGWRGKHTLLLNRQGGSMYFLGDIFVNVALPLSESTTAHCGECRACIDVCPTQAIVAPYQLDARRCISYLTIEHKGPIPEELRPLMGSRIYGCDDCQLVCPWNKFAQPAVVADFETKTHWQGARLWDLFQWTEDEFLRHTEGSAIRRIGHERWLRNLAVAMGNALRQYHRPSNTSNVTGADRDALVNALQHRLDHPSPLVRSHVEWALAPTIEA